MARRRSSSSILPDTGRNYLSKLYDDEWMRKTGLLGWEAAARRSRRCSLAATTAARTTGPSSCRGRPTWSATAIETLERHGISQMPVSERDDDAIEGIVGSLNERSLLERAYRDPSVVERTVGEVMERPLPIDRCAASLDDAFTALSEGAPALVAVRAGGRRAS